MGPNNQIKNLKIAIGILVAIIIFQFWYYSDSMVCSRKAKVLIQELGITKEEAVDWTNKCIETERAFFDQQNY